ANATALTSIAHTVTGVAPGDDVSTHTILFTVHEFISYARAPGTTALVAPASLLVAGDDQQVRVSATAGNTVRTAGYGTPGPTALTLPPAILGVAFSAAQGDLVASFGALPSGDTLEIFAFGDTTGFQFLDASRAFVDKTHATKLAFDSSMPGFKP